MNANQDRSPEKRRRPRSRWMLVTLVVLCAALNASLLPAIEWVDARGFDEQIKLLLVMVGLVSGQACSVVLWSSLARRTWIGGLYLGLAITVLGYAALLLGAWLSDNYDAEVWVAFCWLPGLLLAATTPMFLCRQILGWRLADREAQLSSQPPFQLGDLFNFMAILAAALVLLRAPQVILESEPGNYWPPLLISCAVLFGVGLLVLPLVTKLAFGMRSRAVSLLGLLGVAVAVLAVLFGILQSFQSWQTPWSERWEVLQFLLCGLLPLFGIFYLSLWWLAWCGAALHRTRKQPGGARDQMASPAIPNWQVRLRIVAAIAVAAATSAALARLEQWRRNQDAEIDALQAIAEQLEGSLYASDRQVRYLTLGPPATNDDLPRFRACRELTSLDVSHSQVTDVGLMHLKQFPNLQAFNAGQTSITGAGLGFAPRSLSTLQAKHSKFDDRGCEQLVRLTELRFVELQGTRVTDAGLLHLGKLPQLTTLDLSETEVTADVPALRGFPELQTLYLNRSRVGDAGVAMLIRLPTLSVLHLQGASISDAGLVDLAQSHTLAGLDLSDTTVSNAGIAHLRSKPLAWLDVSGTAVTGEVFATWQSHPKGMSLLLARTSITDEELVHLQRLSPLDQLSLADTTVTDAGLVHFLGATIEHLDLSRTKVTAQGLMTNRLLGVSSFALAPRQFPPDEMAQLTRQFGDKLQISDSDEQPGF